MHQSIRMLMLCPVALATACSGNGMGLDTSGRPIGAADTPLVAEFASIQQHVFTPFCVTCHAGAAAPQGLRLTADVSYAALVNAPSNEVSSLRRVAPGNPAASYLLQKIAGTAAVGARMPLGGPPLPAQTIAIVQQWIAAGALPPAGVAPLDGTPATLTEVFPMYAATLPPGGSDAVIIAALHELDVATLDVGSISLTVSTEGDGVTPGADVGVALQPIEVRTLAPTIIALAPLQTWKPGHYRLRIRGSGPLAARDLTGIRIDGDADGLPGGDYLLDFEISSDPGVSR